MSVMGIYRVPLVWQMYGHMDVEAKSLHEAIKYALGPECPLPEGSYVDDSIMVDSVVMEHYDEAHRMEFQA